MVHEYDANRAPNKAETPSMICCPAMARELYER